MGVDSTAELLFKISANSDEAAANMEKFRVLMGEDLAFVRENFEDFGASAIQQQAGLAAALTETTTAETAQVAATEALAAAHGHAVSEIQATSGAIRLLEGSGGIRAMERFTATTLGLGPAMQAIFPIVGALAFTEIIVRMGEKVYDMVEKWNPVTQAEQRATDTAKALSAVIQQTGEEIRKLDAEALVRALGKPTASLVEAQQIISTKIQADKQMIAGLLIQISEAEKPIATGTTGGVGSIAAGAPGNLSRAAQAAKKDIETLREQMSAFQMDVEKNEREVAKLIAEGSEAQIHQNERMAETTTEAKQQFGGLVAIVESMKAKIAEQGTPWDRLAEEVSHYHVEITKATAELNKLQKEGKITPESLQSSQAALAQIPTLLAKVIADTTTKINAEETQRWGEAIQRSFEAYDRLDEEQEKAGERRIEVTRQISDREAAAGEQGYAQQRAALQRQMDDWAASLAKKTTLTAEDWDKIDKITTEGLAKIDRTEAGAYQQELQKLNEHLDSVTAANATAEEKITLDYQRELEQYSQIEEQKALKTAQTEAQVTQIQQMYAQIRQQLLTKYQTDLMTLRNSQGFQSTFGNYFGTMIRQNSDLWRQWQTSASQSVLLVQVAMQSLQDQVQKTFQSFVQGMGQSIAQAIVMKTSITQAMEQMLKSTLESFAGQAITAALMALGWGFYDLAIGADAQAASAFTAAAVFGTVGAAAAIAGRMMPSASGAPGTGSGAGSGAGAGSGVGGSGGGSGAGSGQQQPYVHVEINGPVIGPSGAAQLCDIINQAVYGNDVQLYASHNPQGVPL